MTQHRVHSWRIVFWLLFTGVLGGPVGSAFGQNEAAKVLDTPRIGQTVSRPALTYVQVGQEIHAAMVVGCGDDPDADRAAQAVDDAPGRCVLVIKVSDGTILRRFQTGSGLRGGDRMNYPVNGSATVYPAVGILPAERAYIGDRIGRMWRVDLRSANPNTWSMAVAWPPDDEEEAEGFTTGRTVVDRPSVSLRASGKLAVVYGTGDKTLNNDARAAVVSFTDEAVLGDGEQLSFQVARNWVLPLRDNEYVSGPPVVRYGIAFFTSIQTGQAGVCDVGLGRLYGALFTKTSEPYGTADGRTLDVVPGLPPLVTTQGQRVTDALALRLPQGKVAHGLTMVTTLSCLEDEEAITEVVLNLAQGTGTEGAGGGETKIERKTGQVIAGSVRGDFINEGRNDVAIKMDNIELVQRANRSVDMSRTPFPRRVLYWGAGFSQ
ncbi:MAG: hypothetical protein VX589_20025 [Myxococcota bacterium]|nr:hypothetical protein [Myxococcota bacterium]